jgi:hypothetical protein
VQYRTVHGYRRAFVYTGSGSALLLIHGIGDSSDPWRELVSTTCCACSMRYSMHPRASRSCAPCAQSSIAAVSSSPYTSHHSDPQRFEAVLRDFLASTPAAACSPEEWRELPRRGRFDSLPSVPPAPPTAVSHTLAVVPEAALSG